MDCVHHSRIGFLEFKSYHYRRDGLFKSHGKTTTAEIVDRDTERGKSKTRHYIYYRYYVEEQAYTERDLVDFDVYFNFELGPMIYVDYVEGRPTISRINRSSLIPDPEAQEKFLKWQREN